MSQASLRLVTIVARKLARSHKKVYWTKTRASINHKMRSKYQIQIDNIQLIRILEHWTPTTIQFPTQKHLSKTAWLIIIKTKQVQVIMIPGDILDRAILIIITRKHSKMMMKNSIRTFLSLVSMTWWYHLRNWMIWKHFSRLILRIFRQSVGKFLSISMTIASKNTNSSQN